MSSGPSSYIFNLGIVLVSGELQFCLIARRTGLCKHIPTQLFIVTKRLQSFKKFGFQVTVGWWLQNFYEWMERGAGEYWILSAKELKIWILTSINYPLHLKSPPLTKGFHVISHLTAPPWNTQCWHYIQVHTVLSNVEQKSNCWSLQATETIQVWHSRPSMHHSRVIWGMWLKG